MLEASSVVEHFPYAGILFLLFLGEIGFPFPEDAILILSGLLIAQRVTKLIPTLLVLYCGLLMTDFSLYWVGKKYGRKVVEHKRFQRILSPDRLVKLEEKFKRRGIWVIFVGRHFLGLRAQVFLAAGVMRMSPVKFLMADALSSIFTMTVMVGIGYWGGNSIDLLKKDVTKIEHLAVLVFLLLVVAWSLFRYFKSRNTTKR